MKKWTRKRHQLHEILLIAVCSMIAGGKGPTDFERFGKAKHPPLRKFLALENGIPSHDTFRYVLANMDPRRSTPRNHEGGPVRRASREVFQYSSTSVQRPVRLVAVRWLLAAETLPTHQNRLRPRKGDQTILMRRPYRSDFSSCNFMCKYVIIQPVTEVVAFSDECAVGSD